MTAGRETDLYPPVKQFLEAQGYEVRGEVRGCDLAAVKGDALVIVELKSSPSLTLVLQGVARLKLTETVYLAVEAAGMRARPRRREVVQLCRCLGLGLLTVRFTGPAPVVEVACDPGPYTPRQIKAKRQLLLGEFARRSADHNTGGGNRRPIVTAYREEVLRLAAELARNGPSTVKHLRGTTGCDKAGGMLRDNFYSWFARASRGVYRLTPQGERALAEYADVVASWKPEGG